MKNYYEKLVEEKGEAAAKEFMRSIQAKRKTKVIPEGFKNPETLKKALDKRKGA